MYCPEELVEMEVEILRTLGWRLNGLTPCDFIHHFFELLPPSLDKESIEMLVNRAVKNSEDVMAEYSVALEPYSSIALAAINALSLSNVLFYEQLNTTTWMAVIASAMNN